MLSLLLDSSIPSNIKWRGSVHDMVVVTVGERDDDDNMFVQGRPNNTLQTWLLLLLWFKEEDKRKKIVLNKLSVRISSSNTLARSVV